MTDWRTHPRTGKSQFFPLMQDIKSRLVLGETYKQIHDDLTASKQIKIGYDQFARYIRNHLKTELIKTDPAKSPPAVRTVQHSSASKTYQPPRQFKHNPKPPDDLLD